MGVNSTNHNYRSLISIYCDNTATYPGPTPLFHFKAGLTASTNTDGFNTVNTSSQYTRWWDYSGSGLHQDTTIGSSWYRYNTSKIRNGIIPFFAGNGAITNKAPSATKNLNPGVGTIFIAYRTANESITGNHTWGVRDVKSTGDNTRGYYHTPGNMAILGSNYKFTYTESQNKWYVVGISQTSASAHNWAKVNGVNMATASYTQPFGSPSFISGSEFRFTHDSSLSGDSECIGEIIYFKTALTANECEDISLYLRSRWCV